jgi:cryptochrome
MARCPPDLAHTAPRPQGLRLHDNPALLEACRGAQHVYPVFVIDPYFIKSGAYK